MKSYLKLIECIDFLKPLEAQDIKACLNRGSFKIIQYGKNNIIHFSGEVCLKIEIILMGKVTVQRIDENGNLMVIGEFFSGDILGGNLIFSKNPSYPLMVIADRDTVILEINKDCLFKLLRGNQAFLSNYLACISDNTLILGDKIKHYMRRTIRESIISYLDYEREKQGSNIILLSMTKKALAERIGVQRTSLSREFTKMKEEGLIDYDAKSVRLLKKFFLRPYTNSNGKA